jgi:hypothetical protein
MRVAALVLLVCLTTVITSSAQVTVVREGEENPVITIAKSTAWGGLAGLVLGTAVALVAEENEGDIIKWFFVGGTFGGFTYGVIHTVTRERPSTALLRMDREGLDWNVPSVALRRSVVGEYRSAEAAVTLFHLSF